MPLDNALPFIRYSRSTKPATSRSKTTAGFERERSHHSYPFDTLPTLVSRVKPHFVICDACPKLVHREWSEIAPIVSSVCGIDENTAESMLTLVRDAYTLWGSRRPPPTFASLPRKPLQMFVAKTPPETRICCDGPCFYSQYQWSRHRCDRCKDSSSYCSLRGIGSTDSDSCDEFLSSSGTDGEREGPQHQGHLKYLHRRVDEWLSSCSQQVKKRGWTYSVLNDDQLGDYAYDRPRKRRRII